MFKKYIKIILVCVLLCGCHPIETYFGKVYIQNKEYTFDENAEVSTYDIKTKKDLVKIKTLTSCGDALIFLEREDVEFVSRKDKPVGMFQIHLIPRTEGSDLQELTLKVKNTPTTIKVKLVGPQFDYLDDAPYDEWNAKHEFILNVTE